MLTSAKTIGESLNLDVPTSASLPSDASSIWARLRGKHILLLQGPMGPFFRRVAARLRSHGALVSKVNFNLADAVYFCPFPNGHLYRGTLREWPEYLDKIIVDTSVDGLMLFGDCRPYHRAAVECARRLGVEIYVFEEGYLRPNFVTLERGGVNGYSQLPRDTAFYRSIDIEPLPPAPRVRCEYGSGVFHSIVYAVIFSMFRWVTPEYNHHRDLHCIRQGLLWLRAGARRISSSRRDRNVTQMMLSRKFPYFLVPLQVHLDSQISHSRFRDVTEFIEVVVRSFALHAPKHSGLVLKGHPLDRPYRDYTALVERLRNEYGLGPRLHYADVVCLPEALKNARGTIVINSTVGLASLVQLTPTACLGRAIYDLPGLTYQGSLDDFWQEPGQVDRVLIEKFVYFIRVETQLPGSVWSGLAS